MKTKNLTLILAVITLTAGIALWQQASESKPPALLSFRIGQTFEEVVKASSYPVMERSNIPTHSYLRAGQTFVTEPSVILQFNDAEHGFILPATTFAMITYMDNRVRTMATSPMLEKKPFDQSVAILENLQKQFKAGGWEPWDGDGSRWFDLTAEGKQRLYARMFQAGFAEQTTLRVPNKYGAILRIWCAKGCMPNRPPYLFMIDVGVGRDVYADFSPNSTSK